MARLLISSPESRRKRTSNNGAGLLQRAYGSDFLNSRVVPSALILPSISGAATLRTSIAASENTIATISALTETARYRFDALYIKPLPALHVIPPQGQREQASSSRRAIWWRAGGDLAALHSGSDRVQLLARIGVVHARNQGALGPPPPKPRHKPAKEYEVVR
jgi:hypothetical protein